MKPLDQLIAEQLRLPPILPQIRHELCKVPGVLGVGIGFRVTNNRITDDIVFSICVERKRPLYEIPEDQRIPPVIEGVQTDVILPFVWRSILLAEEERDRRVSTLAGGVSISPEDAITRGTLGCFATLKSDPTVALLLTNHHTLYENPTDTGLGPLVGQPDITCSWCCKTGVIGRAHDGIQGGLVDCATARLNKKRPFVQRLPGIGKDANGRNEDLITGVPTTVPVAGIPTGVLVGEPVRKLGRSTSNTLGIVHKIHDNFVVNGIPFDEQIIIRPEAGGDLGDGRLNFGTDGDSGAVVINRFNQVVGLLHKAADFTGRPENQPNWWRWGAACHIHHVIGLLQIDIIRGPGANTRDTPGTPTPVVPTGALVPGTGLVRRRLTDEDRARARILDAVITELGASPLGARILELYDRHHREVQQLVTHDRRVKIAWHRSQGPAFVAIFLSGLWALDREIPKMIDGLPIEAALHRMVEVLAERGSAPLGAAARESLPLALDILSESVSLRDAFAAIRTRGGR